MDNDYKYEVLRRIENEGFDYTFRYYSNWTEIKDEKFHELREKYISVAQELEKYLDIED